MDIDVSRYATDGFAVLRRILPPILLESVRTEVEAWRTTNAVLDPRNVRFRLKNRSPDGALVLDSIDPVLDLFPSIEAVARHPMILRALETIYGEPACLFKDKLILKEPGVPGFPLHQDYVAWPDFPRSFVTVVVPLDLATHGNGCIEVFPDVHHRGPLAPCDGDFHDLAETSMGSAQPVPLELEPGDIAFFGCFVPHRSGMNRTNTPRRQLYLSYNRRSEFGDYRSAHYDSYRRWLLRRYAEFGAAGFYFA